MTRLIAVAIAASAVILSGCGLFGAKGAPPPLKVSITASSRLNPDDEGNALPTLVRVYQLASPARARSAELGDLLRDPKAVLAEDLLSVEELQLTPGAKLDRTLPREQTARAVLIAAVVRRPAGESWKDVVELPASKSPPLAYLVEEYRLSRR
ncbi:MAG: type VI secretion system lipoprotein TssJ [Anaeromyxobacter sp.]